MADKKYKIHWSADFYDFFLKKSPWGLLELHGDCLGIA
jgi:hypothetical protein